ncbi:unnamed protein product [Pleuronectes platessa]|uniref:Uncharacterized protein n=1 Tax=Pleuronectes platessa TaxID=8262 RepID=A0A9N7VW31_PLEPL|nr:unnamed protein product [Pleuronectes platessa]
MEQVPLNNGQPGTPGTLQLALTNGYIGVFMLGNTWESCVGVPAVISMAMLPASVQPPQPPGCPADAMGLSGHPWLNNMGGSVCVTLSWNWQPSQSHRVWPSVLSTNITTTGVQSWKGLDRATTQTTQLDDRPRLPQDAGQVPKRPASGEPEDD